MTALQNAMLDYFVNTGEVASPAVMQDGLAQLGYAFRDYRERAVIVSHGPEIHLFVADGWRGRAISRKACRDVFGPILESYGYVTTRLKVQDQHEPFILRLGFKPTWSDGLFQYYMLTKMPFSKKVTP